MSEEKTEQQILEVEKKNNIFDKFRHDYRQGRSQHNTAGGEKKIPVGPNIYHLLRTKARKNQNHNNICCLLLLCYFSKNTVK